LKPSVRILTASVRFLKPSVRNISADVRILKPSVRIFLSNVRNLKPSVRKFLANVRNIFIEFGLKWAKFDEKGAKWGFFAPTLAKASLPFLLQWNFLGLMPCRIIQLRRSTRRFC
jgi:hypothetical protein